MKLRPTSLIYPSVRQQLVFAAAVALLAASGCESQNTFSDVPEISPAAVKVYHITEPGGTRPIEIDSVTVTVNWSDGNGDLGLLPDADVKEQNYFLTLFKQKNGEFIAITTTNSFNGRFKSLNPEGESSTKPFKLRGDLTCAVASPGFLMTPPQVVGTIGGVREYLRTGDVIRFTVQIKDRAGNLSNVVTTEAVTL